MQLQDQLVAECEVALVEVLVVAEAAGGRDGRHVGVVAEAREEDQHVAVGAVDGFRARLHVSIPVVPAIARRRKAGIVVRGAELVAEGHAHEVPPGGAL